MNQRRPDRLDSPLEPEERVLTLDEAMHLAQELHRAGQLAAAEKIYRALLERRPDDPDVLHYLGVVVHHAGDTNAGLALIRRALVLAPETPGTWNNLGNVLVQSERVEEAIDAYRRALSLAPEFAETHNNLGTIYRFQGSWDQAEASYRKALAARPDFADAYHNLANLRVAQRRTQDAVTFACKAIACGPRHAGARKLLARAYYTLGEMDKAAEVYREWLAEEPDDPIALHHLAACTGDRVPPRASDTYVEASFDAFADSFDAQLQHLSYRAPHLIAAALRAACGSPRATLTILDAGCGTGLCGPLVRQHARHLEGVDLSGGMIERARLRGVHDSLTKAELTAFLATRPAMYDVVLSADTLCYFGDLDSAMHAASAALRPGGVILFTVEALSNDDPASFRLQPHGRYAHSSGYLRSCITSSGLEPIRLDQESLRNENGTPVLGWVVTARKPAEPLARG